MSSSEAKSSTENNIQSKGRGRPPKKIQSPIASASTTCTWCAESKTPLKYVLPTQTGKKEFCSETCIAEFRKAYNKGACVECDNVIRSNAPNKEFCSSYCLNKNKKKNGAALAAQNSGRLSLNNNNLQSASNNNNKDSPGGSPNPVKTVKNLGDTGNFKDHFAMNRTGPSPMFQYEHFQVFDWKDYLKVSNFIQ